MDRNIFINNLIYLTGLKKTHLSIEIFGNKSALSQGQYKLDKIVEWCLEKGYSLGDVFRKDLPARRGKMFSDKLKRREEDQFYVEISPFRNLVNGTLYQDKPIIKLMVYRDYWEREGYDLEQIKFFKIIGDHQAPNVPAGSIIWVDCNDKRIGHGYFLMRYGEWGTMKKVQPTTRNTVIVKSNEEFEREEIDFSEFQKRVLGRIIYITKKV